MKTEALQETVQAALDRCAEIGRKAPYIVSVIDGNGTVIVLRFSEPYQRPAVIIEHYEQGVSELRNTFAVVAVDQQAEIVAYTVTPQADLKLVN
jgi:hypothetical protein